MGGFFGTISKRDCVMDVFFGTDYHSHLGTKRGGMAVYDPKIGFQRQIHNIENTPFRTKFDKDLAEFKGCSAIGCISDTDPQPLLVRSHLGLYAIITVGIINNSEALIERYFSDHGHQFMAMSSGKVNATELATALINQKDDLVSGIRHAQEEIDGSCTMLILTPDGIIAARDKLGRLPVLIGQNDEGCCVSFESFAYHKLGYIDAYELGPGEVVKVTARGWETLAPAGDKMKICAFLWTYYGYPNSNYEGVNVEVMRYRNGEIMARDEVQKGQLPKHLALSIAALLAFYRGTEFEGDALVGERAGEKYLIKDTKEYLETFAELHKADYKCNGCRAKAVVEAILPRTDWWGLDLTTVPGLKDAVQGYLQTILDEGMEAAIRSLD